MKKFLDWLKADSAIGEVMRGRVQKALDAQKDMERCRSRMSMLKYNCPNFEPIKEKK